METDKLYMKRQKIGVRKILEKIKEYFGLRKCGF